MKELHLFLLQILRGLLIMETLNTYFSNLIRSTNRTELNSYFEVLYGNGVFCIQHVSQATNINSCITKNSFSTLKLKSSDFIFENIFHLPSIISIPL